MQVSDSISTQPFHDDSDVTGILALKLSVFSPSMLQRFNVQRSTLVE